MGLISTSSRPASFRCPQSFHGEVSLAEGDAGRAPGVPTPGASDGSTTSISNEVTKPAVPCVTAARLFSITTRRPSSSIARMVKTLTPESFTTARSRASRLRAPIRTQFLARILGA